MADEDYEIFPRKELQRLKREIAYLKGHVIILSIDPTTLSEPELKLLEKESEEV